MWEAGLYGTNGGSGLLPCPALTRLVDSSAEVPRMTAVRSILGISSVEPGRVSSRVPDLGWQTRVWGSH